MIEMSVVREGTVRVRAPKRKIERKRTSLNLAMTESVVDYAIHDAEDAHTLVRTLAELKIGLSGTITAEVSYEVVIAVAPRGQTVAAAPSISTVQDTPVPTEELFRSRGKFSSFADNGDHRHVWDIDSKAMRKLKEGDQIHISYICDDANMVKMVGTIYMWFKE